MESYFIKTGYASLMMTNGEEKYWKKHILHHMQCILEVKKCTTPSKKTIGGMVWRETLRSSFQMFVLSTSKVEHQVPVGLAQPLSMPE